jgi:hypothetical protein
MMFIYFSFSVLSARDWRDKSAGVVGRGESKVLFSGIFPETPPRAAS